MSRLLPSMLFVPASDQRKLDKIASLQATAYIIDLEDAVANSAKAAARVNASAAVRQYGAAQHLYVRINSIWSDLWEDDLAAVAWPELHGINLPKVEAAQQIVALDERLYALEDERGMPRGRLALMATVETVAGIRNVEAIATASPRLQRLCFGAIDFSLDIGIDWPPLDGRTSPTVVAAKVALVMASRTAGLQPPQDGVFPNFRDTAALRAETEEARAIGFFGKQAIHPNQLPVIEAVFRPSAEQIAHARKVVETFEASEAEGRANLHLDGQFIDYPVVARARQVLALAADEET